MYLGYFIDAICTHSSSVVKNVASLAVPPVKKNTKGVNVPNFTSVALTIFPSLLSLSCDLQTKDNKEFLLDGVKGLKTRTYI